MLVFRPQFVRFGHFSATLSQNSIPVEMGPGGDGRASIDTLPLARFVRFGHLAESDKGLPSVGTCGGGVDVVEVVSRTLSESTGDARWDQHAFSFPTAGSVPGEAGAPTHARFA
jgi:hypothetical protein